MQSPSAPTPFQALISRITAVAIGNGTVHISSVIQRASSSSRAPMSSVQRRRTSSPPGPSSWSARGVEEFDGLRERVDRPRVDEDERTWQRRIPCGELDGDHPAEAVPDHDRLLDTDLRAKRCEVVGEVADVVAAFRAVALSATAQVERGHGVRPLEVVELRLERSAVATPAVDEEQLRLAAACPLVVQPHAIEIRVRHDPLIVSPPSPRPKVSHGRAFGNVT